MFSWQFSEFTLHLQFKFQLVCFLRNGRRRMARLLNITEDHMNIGCNDDGNDDDDEEGRKVKELTTGCMQLHCNHHHRLPHPVHNRSCI